MSGGTLTTISGSSAGGDIAGGDITKTTVYQGPRSALREMTERFRLECAADKHLSCFIERLQHFVAAAPESPSRDLETKLRDGGRPDLVRDALLLKERFAKKLLRLQFSEQAQEIFAHVLSKIHAFFTLRVHPRSGANVARPQIDDLIYQELLAPLYDEIGNSELGLDLLDLQGMVYYLGGNCHIRWD
jgi:hypothetical protein